MTEPGLRVLEVFQPPDGGVPEHVRQLSLALLGHGHDVVVAAPADAAPRAELQAAGARFVAVPLEGAMGAVGADRRALVGLIEVLRSERFDLVHAHGQKAGMLARVAGLRTQTPAVYTPHALVYRTQLLRPVRARRLRHAATRGMERALGRRSAALVAVSGDEQRAMVADRLAPAERVHLIPNGVAVQRDAVPDARLTAFAGEGPLVGFVAGLRDQKGLPTLLDALAELARRGRPVLCAIVGNGPLQADVGARIEAEGLSATTLLVPFSGRPEPYLAALDVYVLPSYWEGLPIGLLEAMAMGVAPVTTAVGGSAEVVQDGVSGLLVAPRDAAGLADALATLCTDDGLRARIGAAAQERVAEGYALASMLDATEVLYHQVARR